MSGTSGPGSGDRPNDGPSESVSLSSSVSTTAMLNDGGATEMFDFSELEGKDTAQQVSVLS